MNGGQLNITLKTPLDVLYFNNDKTQLQECLNQFLSEDVSYYQLTQKQSRQAIIDDFFNGYKNTIHPDLYAAFSSTLRKAVSGVFGNDPENRFSDLKDKLICNVSRFAAYKAYHCSRVIDRQRATEDGELVSKKEFEELANKVISTYSRWQAAEYNTAVTRARTAKQFTVFNDPDNVRLFPCLRWIPSRSVEQRDEHKPFYNLVLPKDHPFWQSNQPGNLWNCKCDWEETNAQQSKGYPKTKINSQGLEGNPATTGEVFTDRHTYFAKAGKDVEKYALGIVRKDHSEWAKKHLKGTTVKHPEIESEIRFSNKSIKEYLNQPHEDYWLKNELIRRMPQILKNAEYMGVKEHKMRKSLIFKIKLNGKLNYLIANKQDNVTIIFHSISESDKVLIGIKKE